MILSPENSIRKNDKMETFDPPPGAMAGATVILFNGPPYCGKDTAGKYLNGLVSHSRIVKFAGTLKHSVHIDYGLYLPEDSFEGCKDQPHPAFFGLTPRAAYIQKSEERQKPFLGQDIYGRTALRRMWRAYQEGIRTFLVTDSGFSYEAAPVIEAVGSKNVLLLRIHAEERGCSFANDSRSYIQLDNIATYDVENNRSIEEFQGLVMGLVYPFLHDGTTFDTFGQSISSLEDIGN